MLRLIRIGMSIALIVALAKMQSWELLAVVLILLTLGQEAIIYVMKKELL